MSTGGLAQAAGRGAVFTITAQAIRLLLQIVSVVVLSRLLTPTEYGIVAIVLVVVAFGETFRDLGLSTASVQAKTLSSDQRTNLLWVNTGIGAVLSVIVLVSAPLIAFVSRAPETQEVAYALSALFLINGLATQYRASLLRSLRFRALAIVDVASSAAALAIAIMAAAVGFGFWALVLQQVAQTLLVLVGCVAAARWLPRLPNRRGDIRPFLALGWNLVGSQLVAYVSSNIDTLLVGLRFGTTALGYYNRAFQLVMTPVNQIRAPMTTVALPVLSRIQDSPKRFNEYVVIGQLALSYPICLALGAVSALADPLVSVALGPQWDQSAPLVRLLAISAMFQTLAFVGYWVYVSRGLGRALLRYSLVSAAVRVSCIVIGSQWGVIGVAAGFTIGPALTWPISLAWLSRVTDVPTKRLYLGAGRVLALVGVAYVVTSMALLAFPALSAIALILAGSGVYLAVILSALVLSWYRGDVRSVIQIVRVIRGSR